MSVWIIKTCLSEKPNSAGGALQDAWGQKVLNLSWYKFLLEVLL